MSTPEELGFPALEPEPAPQPETQQEQPETTQEAVPRDERGRFAPRQDEPAAPTEAERLDDRQRVPDGYVPITALQKMRDEMRELKQQLQRPPPRTQQDEDAQFARMTPQQQAEWQYRNDMLNMHEATARAQYGVDVVEQAKEWFQSAGGRDPGVIAAIQAAPFPYEELVQHYMAEVQAQTLLQLVQQGFDPADPDKWALERARQLAAEQQRAPPQQQPSSAPKSIANVPASGQSATGPIGPGVAFDSVFR